jgi:hypothetical protein
VRGSLPLFVFLAPLGQSFVEIPLENIVGGTVVIHDDAIQYAVVFGMEAKSAVEDAMGLHAL